MNYYQHHIGDYRRDTAHLTLLEHGVYRQLLDMYYLSEQPIPTETEVVFRRLCARTEEEKQAVITILKEFFTLGNGYTHKRCDEEIASYHGKADRARNNGKLGGRPKKTEVVNSGIPEETDSKANHKPLTINHKPLTSIKEETSGAEAPCPDDTPADKKSGSRARAMIVRQTALGILDYLNLRADREFMPMDTHVSLIVARLKEGITEDQLRSVIDKKVKQWKGDPKMDVFLRPSTLFGKTNCANYVGEREVSGALSELGEAGRATALAGEQFLYGEKWE